MPLKVRDLAEDQSLFEFSEIEGVEAAFHEPNMNDAAIEKFFAPKAFIAKDSYEKRKIQQDRQKYWLESVNNRQTQLRQQKAKLEEIVKKTSTQSGHSGRFGL